LTAFVHTHLSSSSCAAFSLSDYGEGLRTGNWRERYCDCNDVRTVDHSFGLSTWGSCGSFDCSLAFTNYGETPNKMASCFFFWRQRCGKRNGSLCWGVGSSAGEFSQGQRM
jgi:hypothetical protein